MSYAGLKRNRTLLMDNFQTVGDQVMVRQACKIVIPYNYLKYRLARIGERTNILAVAGVIIGEEYGVLNGCCSLEITPSTTRQVVVGGVEYLEFEFEAGSIVVGSLDFVIDSDLLYDMHMYFYANGRVPWFMDYDDLSRLFILHRPYGGLNIAPNNIPFEIYTAMICRDPKNKFKLYRHTDMKFTPVVIPFNSVLFNANSTTAKLLGSNLVDGFASALANPTTQSEPLENMLRQ